MGILKRLFGGGTDKPTSAQSPTATVERVGITADEPVTLRVSRRSKPWVRDNQYGPGKVEVTGYRFVEADTGMSAYGTDLRGSLAERGAVIFYPAGVTHLEGDILQSDGLQPSRRLSLARDADNEYDPNAVSITLDGRHVGWVPRRDVAPVAAKLDAGEQLEAVVIDQTRDSTGRRVAYSVVVGEPAFLDGLFARARQWTETR